MKKIKHIVISGNIGVGKTTLSEKISKKFNWELQLEEVKDNPYLDDFYKSMKDWSFHLQIFFLNSKAITSYILYLNSYYYLFGDLLCILIFYQRLIFFQIYQMMN